MEQIIEQAKAEFINSKERLVQALANTPDDRVNWSPAPTARTPIQQVAHAALAIPGLIDLLMGKPFEFTSSSELDQALRATEKQFETREQVLELLERNSCAYLAWMDMLTPEQLNSTFAFPLARTPMQVPIHVGITFVAGHMRNHVAQIEYIQTIYGDRDWYM